MDLNDFFEPDQIIGSTINGWITFPAVCVVIVYLLIVGLLIRFYLAHRTGQSHAMTKTGLAILVSAGLFHGLVSDLIWTKWVITDVNKFWGLPNEQKPAAIDGDLYQFILKCRNIVGNQNYFLHPVNGSDDAIVNYFNRRLEYLMLPARRRPDGQYIIVMLDSNVYYDEETKILHDYGNSTTAASLLLKHDNGDALLLRKQ
jgi:hypothetical protein